MSQQGGGDALLLLLRFLLVVLLANLDHTMCVLSTLEERQSVSIY